MSDLRCMTCRYDLHGLVLSRNSYRCPECGQTTQLDQLAADLVHRRRGARALFRDTNLLIALGFGTVLPASGRDAPGAGAVMERLRFLTTERGVILAAAVTAGLYLLTVPHWFERPRWERVTFAIGAALTLLVLPLPWCVPLFVLWWMAFLPRAARW
ncbi:MAG: hypothetical protein GY715_18225 [Planctomycetes bacterium]|nr:hypothetical protein [Planctomycetota bacterium]